MDLGPLEVSPGGLTADGHLEVGIPLSPEGESVKQVVRAPIHERRPVGYDREFLDRYRANETFHLPGETRRRLRESGRSPDGERPAGTYARKIHHRLLIDLSWNSSRLEGNTYSLLETERLLGRGMEADLALALGVSPLPAPLSCQQNQESRDRSDGPSRIRARRHVHGGVGA